MERISDATWSRMSVQVQLALAHAESNIAPSFGHGFVGCEHVLIAICTEFPDAVKELGLDPVKIETLTQFEMGTNTGQVHELPLYPTNSLIKAVVTAKNFRELMDHERIGIGHLLLGIYLEEISIGAWILDKIGLDPEELEDKIKVLFGTTQTPGVGSS